MSSGPSEAEANKLTVFHRGYFGIRSETARAGNGKRYFCNNILAIVQRKYENAIEATFFFLVLDHL
jgi:hypothetical protein